VSGLGIRDPGYAACWYSLITPPSSLPLDRQVRPDGGLGGPLVGRSLLAGLVWPVPIVMIGVPAED
jgi:hypothetical protein